MIIVLYERMLCSVLHSRTQHLIDTNNSRNKNKNYKKMLWILLELRTLVLFHKLDLLIFSTDISYGKSVKTRQIPLATFFVTHFFQEASENISYITVLKSRHIKSHLLLSIGIEIPAHSRIFLVYRWAYLISSYVFIYLQSWIICSIIDNLALYIYKLKH